MLANVVAFRNQAKPMVKDLGSEASWQGFPSFQEALDDYLTAREKGWVRIIRRPGDSVAVFGPRHAAEDLPVVDKEEL